MNQVLNSTPAAPTLAELAAAQEASPITAFNLGDDQRHLTRLQALYAKKCAQLATFYDLFEEVPDIILRTANGQEAILRLSVSEAGEAFSGLRDAQEAALRELEKQIIEQCLIIEEVAQLERKQLDPARSYRLAIGALCLPTAPTAARPAESGVPLMTVQARPDSTLSAAA